MIFIKASIRSGLIIGRYSIFIDSEQIGGTKNLVKASLFIFVPKMNERLKSNMRVSR